MNHWLRTVTTSLALLVLGVPLHAAHANLSDDKPWDWEGEGLISGAEGNSNSVSLTEELRTKHNHPTLKLTLDHASWDAYLQQQLKQPVLSKRLGSTPGGVCGMAFRLIRVDNDGGTWPGYGHNPPDTEDLETELRAKINEINCKYDLKAARDRFEYNPATKVITYFAGRENSGSATEFQSDLIKLAKQYFPKLKAWYIRHGKIEG